MLNIKKSIVALFTLLAIVRAQTSSMSVLQDLFRERGKYLGSLTFWRSTLLYMQKDDGNTKSQCIVTFDEFIVLQNGIAAKLATDTEYYEGLKTKGQGTGSTYGFYIDAGQKYFDVVIYGVNVFNYCDINLYLKAVGKALGSSSGFVNQFINLLWRFFSYEDSLIYYDMSVAMMYGNQTENVGKGFGKFLKLFLMVETPEATEAPSY